MMTTTGIYSVCAVSAELQTERVTGVAIETDSMAQAYEIWNMLPGMLFNTFGDGRYVILRTVRESDYDRTGPQG